MHIGEDVVRERALRLVHTKLKTGESDLLNKPAQAQLVAEVKKVFASVRFSPFRYQIVNFGDKFNIPT